MFLPLVFVGAVPFIVFRALAGLSTAMYDPAARGTITDLTPPERRGEAFGLYSAAQMGGLLFGPAIGGLGTALFGGVGFVFIFGALSSILAAACVGASRVRETAGPVARATRRRPTTRPSSRPGRPSSPATTTAAVPGAPPRLFNRLLFAAIIINIGANFSAGTYDVVWSLYLERLGAGDRADRLHVRDVRAADPAALAVLRAAGRSRRARLVRDPRRAGPGGHRRPVHGHADPLWAVPLILIEATGFAALIPALYAIVAAGSPPGRSSTAQGIFGGAGTIGFVVASLMAGYLAAVDIRLPFWFFSAVMLTCLGIGLLVAGRGLVHVRAGVAGGRRGGGAGGLTAPRRLTDPGAEGNVIGRGVEQRQLVGLITRRSEVRILSPQPIASTRTPVPTTGVLPFGRGPALLPAERPRGEQHGRRRPRSRAGQATAAHRGGAGDEPSATRKGVRSARAAGSAPAIAASGAGRWSTGTMIPPSARLATNRTFATASIVSALSRPASSSPRPANASVPSSTATTTSAADRARAAPASRARRPRRRRAARPGRPRRPGPR